jgi:hypothetical protein
MLITREQKAFSTLRDAPELVARLCRLIEVSIHIELEVRLD